MMGCAISSSAALSAASGCRGAIPAPSLRPSTSPRAVLHVAACTWSIRRLENCCRRSTCPPSACRAISVAWLESRPLFRFCVLDALLQQRTDRRVGRQQRQQGLPAPRRGLLVAGRERGGAEIEQRQCV